MDKYLQLCHCSGIVQELQMCDLGGVATPVCRLRRLGRSLPMRLGESPQLQVCEGDPCRLRGRACPRRCPAAWSRTRGKPDLTMMPVTCAPLSTTACPWPQDVYCLSLAAARARVQAGVASLAVEKGWSPLCPPLVVAATVSRCRPSVCMLCTRTCRVLS